MFKNQKLERLRNAVLSISALNMLNIFGCRVEKPQLGHRTDVSGKRRELGLRVPQPPVTGLLEGLERTGQFAQPVRGAHVQRRRETNQRRWGHARGSIEQLKFRLVPNLTI